eukprot:TRINITY_DN9248_c0_g5_i2.p1 TRINITY_DN9248_c0_g5~~TRINITY_DN9248_c0_g5_i2.p1  ORF type:complete len:644 (-),score=210.64 TRINITY_DN9248_c0_g5_i2:80-2011(-)
MCIRDSINAEYMGKRMEPASQTIDKSVLLTRRKFLEDLLKRRFFYTNAFSIYGGVAGLYDYGPPGCAVKTNVEALWREFFVLEDDMLEISCTNLTPEVVFQASGHVERFNDLIVRDVKNSTGFRADKLVTEFIDKQIEKGNLPPGRKEELEKIARSVDGMKADAMTNLIKELGIKSPDTGNDLSEAVEFNLMFSTQIGPTGTFKGYLRPETAQGIFVNFRRLIEYNGGRMPFACAQIGLGFRNEIAPRAGLLRVREFQMAEIEHFVDPLAKNHPKFGNYASYRLPLYSQQCQTEGTDPVRDLSLGDAVAQKIIDNETLGYFICRTYLFLVACGINPNNIRFRQHQKDEMAHYATDCWDAEIETSYGWVECVGIADRSAYDLTSHSRVSKVELVAARKFTAARQVEVVTLIMDKGKMGKEFKADNRAIQEYLEGLSDAEKRELQKALAEKESTTIQVGEKSFTITRELVKFEVKEQNVMEEKFVPNVIEPSFGIGRIIYALFEHRFKMRDERRTYIDFPPKVAPIKVSIFPVVANPEYRVFVEEIRKSLKRLGISCKVDDSGSSIGRRYARTDEIGIPFAITVDNLTPTEKTVTLRELNTLKQVRISNSQVAQVVWDLVEGNITWNDVTATYKAFELEVGAEDA